MGLKMIFYLTNVTNAVSYLSQALASEAVFMHLLFAPL